MNKLTILILLSLIGMGCKTVNVIQTTATTIKRDTLSPMGTTISFTPSFRTDTSGNIWMYNPGKNKYYKLQEIK